MKLKFVPFEKVIYETKLTEAEVINRLSDSLQPEEFSGSKRVWSAKLSKPYEGIIDGKRFEIKRISDDRVKIPIIIGHVEQNTDKTTIKVMIRVPNDGIIVCCIALLIFGIFSVFNSSYFIFSTSLSFAFMMYVVMMINFESERFKAKKDLQQLLEAEEV